MCLFFNDLARLKVLKKCITMHSDAQKVLKNFAKLTSVLGRLFLTFKCRVIAWWGVYSVSSRLACITDRAECYVHRQTLFIEFEE